MTSKFVALGAAVCVGAGAFASEVKFDFEGGDLQGWQILEGGFGKVVSDRAKEHHGGAPYTKEGQYFVSTLESADGQQPIDTFTGVIESPVVVLSSPEITLRVGGGTGPGVYVAVCSLDGKERAFARGGNAQRMFERQLSVPELTGQPVFFRVADHATGGWGHITLDRLICQGQIDRAATVNRFKSRRREIAKDNGGTASDKLRAAIQELGRLFGSRYPEQALSARLDALETADDAAALDAFAHDALVVNNPLVADHPILFVTRKQYRSDHHNTETMFQTCEINTGSYDTEGALKILNAKTGIATTLFAPVTIATVRDPDICFDA